MNLAATIWVGIITVIFCLPFTPPRRAGQRRLRLERGQLRAADRRRADPRGGIWWLVSARHSFTGPVRNVEFAGEGVGVAEETEQA